jgi:hypothetical protein
MISLLEHEVYTKLHIIAFMGVAERREISLTPKYFNITRCGVQG